MNFLEACVSFFRNYVNFTTRASRSEYWYAQLFTILVSVILSLVDPTQSVEGIWSIAIILPSFAVTTRRLHDINRSGWHQLLGILVPIGSIAVLVWYCTKASDTNDVSALSAGGAATLGSVEVLERLAGLRNSGAISNEEYETEKQKLLK